MNRRSDTIALAEQRVAEARTAAFAEYQAARAKLHRRLGSPMFLGGLLLGAVALGYLAVGGPRRKRPVQPASPGIVPQVVKTIQLLLPLLIALHSSTKTASRPRVRISGAAR